MFRKLTIIFNGVLFYVSSVALVFAQEFQQEFDTIPVIVNGVPVHQPFAGGFGFTPKPTFADVDNDGDFDLFVGEFGSNIHFWRNTGTATNPRFTFETKNFFPIALERERSAPAFADIDDDGDLDLFVSSEGAYMHFYRNVGTATNPIFTFQNRYFVGEIPTFVDIDNDRDFDLFVGDNFFGTISFYRNTGTATNPTFTRETGLVDNIDTGGYSTPTFADIDNDGDFDLFVGEGDGNINFYRNTGTATNPTFAFETANFASIDIGFVSAPTFVDVDKDADFDLFVGEGDGNVILYRNTGTAKNPTFIFESELTIAIGSSSSPTLADIDNDGDFDLFIGEFGIIDFNIIGNINFFRNIGTTTNPTFTLETENLASIGGSWSTPTFADIDYDGDLDLFVGESNGKINLFRNTGTATSPTFILEIKDFSSIDIGDYSTPTFVDIDNDTDLDLFVGEENGNINFYRHTGIATNIFNLEAENFAFIDVGERSAPTFTDIDNDGDFDLFVGEANGNINFFRNRGTAREPIFTLITESFNSIKVRELSSPTFADIDDDGDSDLFVGEDPGGLYFYRNVTPTSVTSPETDGIPISFDLSQNYPNPFNPATTIQYQLPKTSRVQLVIYNLLGQRVTTLVNKQQRAGFYSVHWDGKDDLGRIVPSGVYLYRLETKEFMKIRKLTLVR